MCDARYLSIILPTFNRSRYLTRTVAQIRNQSLQNFELQVIDQSDEHQVELNRQVFAALDNERIRYRRSLTRRVADARNEGLACATRDISVFLDDVILLNDDFQRCHQDAYRDPTTGGATGRTVERTNRENVSGTANRITPGGWTLINLLGQTPCEIDSLKGANMSVRASAFVGLGGFDRSYTGTALLNEADFSRRIMKRGWKLRFEPKVELPHLSAPAGGVRVPTSDQAHYYHFRSNAYFARKLREPTKMVPFFLTHALVAAKLAFARRNFALPAYLIAGSLDGLATLRHGVKEALPDRR